MHDEFSVLLACVVRNRDVEVVEYFCFRFQLSIKLVASEFASASSFFLKVLPLPQKFNRFHIPG